MLQQKKSTQYSVAMKGPSPLAVTSALRGYFIPSSQIQLRKAQADLLNHFVKAKWVQNSVTLTSGDIMNCIEIKKAGVAASPAAHRTLLLTHGFGSGLGFSGPILIIWHPFLIVLSPW
jgi:hypothetical protein